MVSGSLEWCRMGAGGYRGLPMAAGAFPRPWLGRRFPGLALAAARADEAVRPARREQIFDASRLIREASWNSIRQRGKSVMAVSPKQMSDICSYHRTAFPATTN